MSSAGHGSGQPVCCVHSTGNGSISLGSVTPSGWRPIRIASTKSGTSFPAPTPPKRHFELLANTCGGGVTALRVVPDSVAADSTWARGVRPRAILSKPLLCGDLQQRAGLARLHVAGGGWDAPNHSLPVSKQRYSLGQNSRVRRDEAPMTRRHKPYFDGASGVGDGQSRAPAAGRVASGTINPAPLGGDHFPGTKPRGGSRGPAW
jgi:hypothetical protein